MKSIQVERSPYYIACKEELEQALRLFGEYSFDDKGPHEVIELSNLTAPLKALSPPKAAEAIQEVHQSDESNGRLRDLANGIIEELEDWEEFMDEIDALELAW